MKGKKLKNGEGSGPLEQRWGLKLKCGKTPASARCNNARWNAKGNPIRETICPKKTQKQLLERALGIWAAGASLVSMAEEQG